MLQLPPSQCSTRLVWAPVELEPNPTAQISVGATTAMASRPAPLGPGVGLDTIVQFVPFQCSTSGTMPVGLGAFPTAQTSLAATTATPLRELEPMPVLGPGTTLHSLPFQCSVSVLEVVPSL